MSAPEERAGRVATARGWAPDMRSMRLAVVAAAVLVIAGGGAFYAATRYAAPSQGGGAFRIAVTEGACDPAEITVPAGSHRFEVVNRTDRPVKWEILDGVMVVAERENITPGLTQTLSATLEPGDYAITCGLLSNPRGTLHVTRSTVAAANTPAGPRLRDFIGPLSEYKVFLAMQGAALTTKVGELQAAIAANDLGKARDAYVAARLPFERIAPAASRYGDLMNRIDPQAAYLAKREADPAFTGFHRIEYGLYAKNSADGLQPVADQLAADAAALKGRLRELSLEPTMLAEGAARTAQQARLGRDRRGQGRLRRDGPCRHRRQSRRNRQDRRAADAGRRGACAAGRGRRERPPRRRPQGSRRAEGKRRCGETPTRGSPARGARSSPRPSARSARRSAGSIRRSPSARRRAYRCTIPRRARERRVRMRGRGRLSSPTGGGCSWASARQRAVFSPAARWPRGRPRRMRMRG